MNKKLHIKTYGCQANVYDSAKIESILAPLGYTITDQVAEADIVVLNTCHIREKASEKVYSEIGRLDAARKLRIQQGMCRSTIIVAGCVGQAEGEEIFRRSPAVDVVVGPQSYHTIPHLLKKLSEGKKKLIDLDFIEEAKFDLIPEISHANYNTSAVISIQEGCDKFCNFCVVPYTRGAEFSRPVWQIYREVLNAVSNGSKEVILVGQNVNAYHGKNSEGDSISLASLISYIAKIPELKRIRYTTSHPLDMTEELIQLHGSEEKLMPFLHLPVQSGSNKILKLMNRKYSKELYFDIVDRLRKARPDIVLSSDFIVGFPEETDEDFLETLSLVKKIKFGQCYSFKYSPRPGTPAAVKQQIPESVKVERLSALQAELTKQQLEYNETSVGKVMEVLFDRPGKYQNQIIGKTPYMQSVHTLANDKRIYGNMINVKITTALPTSLAGEIITV